MAGTDHGKKIKTFTCLAENAWEISTQHNKNITAAKALSQGRAFCFPHFEEGSLRQLVLKGAIVVQSYLQCHNNDILLWIFWS